MNFEPTERSVKYFRLVTHAMMKASKRENEYYAIEPYFEEAMNSLPEERKELFYLNFERRLHDVGIAKELNMQVSDVVEELTLWIESKNISQEAIDVLADSYKHRFELIEFPQK